jgi:hypothetical protein
MRQRFTRLLSLLTVFCMLALYCTTAQAALQAVGPLDAKNGFPTWYRDATARALEPCISQTLLPSGNPACVLPPLEPGWIPGNPVVFPTNYPFEAFYFIADAADTGAAAGFALVYRAALESTFGTTAPAAGGQVTFTRIRIRIDAPVAGTYTVTHPFGVETFSVTTPGVKAVNMTRDLGITPFPTGALTGDLGPWLTRVGYPQTVIGLTGSETYIGDYGVIGPVTGSPTGNNFVRVVGPAGANLNGAGSNTVTISNFAVAGKVFTGQIPSPMTIDRATYARDAISSQVDVFATALPAAIPAISGTGILTTNLTQDALVPGKFFTHLATATLPSALNITNSLDIPPILHPVTLVDEVNITQAFYNTVTKALTIKAASRDKLAPLPILTVPALAVPNTLIAGTLTKTLPVNTIPPLTVTVNSSSGGSVTAPVSIVTPPAPPVAVADTATTVGTTPVLINVIGNDTAAGIIDPATVVIASPLNGTTVANLNGTVTFTPAAATVYPVAASFTYTVKDAFGQVSNVVTVSVTVTAPVPVTPPVVTPTPPLALADTATTAPGTAVTIPVLANDTTAAPGTLVPASVVVTQTPAQLLAGTAVANVNGTVTFTPAAGFVTGSVAFTYTVANTSALVSTPVAVTVNLAANIPPVANPDAASTFVNTARIINVLANDTDANGTIAANSVVIATLPAPTNGTAVANLNGTVTFTPTTGFAGTGTFSYNVKDNAGATSNNALVTVTIAPAVTDAVTVLKAEYNTVGSQWLVEGTTTNLSTPSRIVTIYLGSDLTGQIIGTIADVGGKWKFQTSASGVVANATNRTISVALPSGASRLAFPVAVK